MTIFQPQEFDIYRTELCGESPDWTKLEPTFIYSHNSNVTSKSEVHESDEKPRQVSAYSLYFKETLPKMKSQYPTANFGAYSRMVAAEWETLCRQKKFVYQQKAQNLRRKLIREAAFEAVRRLSDEHRPREDL